MKNEFEDKLLHIESELEKIEKLIKDGKLAEYISAGMANEREEKLINAVLNFHGQGDHITFKQEYYRDAGLEEKRSCSKY